MPGGGSYADAQGEEVELEEECEIESPSDAGGGVLPYSWRRSTKALAVTLVLAFSFVFFATCPSNDYANYAKWMPESVSANSETLLLSPFPLNHSRCGEPCKNSYTCFERITYLRKDPHKRFEWCPAANQVNNLECSRFCFCSRRDFGSDDDDCSAAPFRGVGILQQNLYGWASRVRSKNYLSLCEYVRANAAYGFDLAGFQEEWNLEKDCIGGAGVTRAIPRGSHSLYKSRTSSVRCEDELRWKLNPSGGNAQNRYLVASVCNKDGVDFVFGTAHWCVDWRGNGECSGRASWNRIENARETLVGLDRLSRGSLPIIFTCDCNTYWGASVRELVNRGFRVAANTRRIQWGFDYVWLYSPPRSNFVVEEVGTVTQSARTRPSFPGPGRPIFHGSDHPGLLCRVVFRKRREPTS